MSRDKNESIITIPDKIGQDLGTIYDASFSTTPQLFLNNKTRQFNQGKAVRGGTILNGMVWTRGPAADYDAWDDLNPGGGWGWHDLLPYFQKVRDGNYCQTDDMLT